MMEDGKILKEKLDDFQIEQITKFFQVRHKHAGADVCDNLTDWSKFDLWVVWNHLLEEVLEVRDILRDSSGNIKRIGPIELKQLRKECVDVANMAFILGEIAKELKLQMMADALPDDFQPDPLSGR